MSAERGGRQERRLAIVGAEPGRLTQQQQKVQEQQIQYASLPSAPHPASAAAPVPCSPPLEPPSGQLLLPPPPAGRHEASRQAFSCCCGHLCFAWRLSLISNASTALLPPDAPAAAEHTSTQHGSSSSIYAIHPRLSAAQQATGRTSRIAYASRCLASSSISISAFSL